MRFPVPPIVLALALALLVAAPVAFVARRRGGRFRGMPGWVGFWAFFAGLAVCLSRAERWISFPILAALMLLGLKQYFSLAPLRPQDRWAILAAYISVPCVLWPVYLDSYRGFDAVVAVGVLLIPLLMSTNSRQAGLLDSTGRVLLGSLLFVFCAAHLGLMAHQSPGRLELFAILAFLSEIPQRLAGRPRLGEGRPLAWLGLAGGVALGAAFGWWLGPLGEVSSARGAVAGLLVALTVAAGGLVAAAVAQDLGLGASYTLVGRGAFLDRSVPAVYAAPVFFHFLRYFL